MTSNSDASYTLPEGPYYVESRPGSGLLPCIHDANEDWIGEAADFGIAQLFACSWDMLEIVQKFITLTTDKEERALREEARALLAHVYGEDRND